MHNDTQDNDIQQNNTQDSDIMHNDTKHNGTWRSILPRWMSFCCVPFMLSVSNKHIMLSVIMSNVAMLFVIMPNVVM